MKTTKKLLFLAAVPLMALACSKLNDAPTQGGQGEIVISAETNSTVDSESFSLRDAVSTVGYSYKITGPSSYSKTGALGTDPITQAVAVGDYTVDITNYEGTFVPAFNTPVYTASMTKSVTANSTTQFNMICKQANVGVQVIFDASLAAYTDLKVTMDATDGDLVYTRTDEGSKIAYFNPGAIKLTLKNNGELVKINNNDSYTITGAARQLWTVKLKTSGSGINSSIIITVSVDTDTDDQNVEIGIGGVVGLGDEVLPYSVNDAINIMPAEDKWIEGIIVGSADISTRTEADNIILGNVESNGVGSQIILVLEDPDMKAALNLEDNSTNLGKVIRIKGDIVGGSLGNTSASIVNVDEYSVGTLKDAGFPVGVAIRQEYFGKDLLAGEDLYVRAVKRNFNSITPENAMKMAQYATGPDPATWNWSIPDAYVKFAEENGMRVHGHTLIWYRDIPLWVRNFTGNRDAWIKLMQDYIKAVVGHYRGRVASWDVVNEAFNKDGSLYNGQGGSEPNVWQINIGDDYMKYAFEAARAADSDCKLFYNDNQLMWPDTKHEIIINKLAELKESGLDGIGIQTHTDIFNAQTAGLEYNHTPEMLVLAADKLGLVHLSELDIRMSHDDRPYDSFTPEVDSIQAVCYKDMFTAYMDNVPADKRWGITIWGVTDKYTYINEEFERKQWPLIFDLNYKPKAAYQGILDSFAL